MKKPIRATGNYVILKLVKVKKDEKTKGGILLVNNKEKYKAIVFDIGPDVKDVNFKEGDNVVFNEYDKKAVDVDDDIYIIVQAKSVMAVLDNSKIVIEER